MVKRIFTLALTVVVVLSLAACGSSTGSTNVTENNGATSTESQETATDVDLSKTYSAQEILDIAKTVPLLSDGWNVDKNSDIYKKYIEQTITVVGKVSIADSGAGEVELTTTGEDGISVSVYGLPKSTIDSYAAEYPFGNKAEITVKGTITVFDDLGVTLENCSIMD